MSKRSTNIVCKGDVLSIDGVDLFAIRSNDEIFKSLLVPYDIYLRFSNGKSVKIKHHDQPINHLQIQSYINKGVRFFYLSKAEAGSLYNKMINNLPQNKTPTQQELDQLGQALESTLMTCLNNNTSEDLNHLRSVADHVFSLIQTNNDMIITIQRMFSESEYAVKHSIEAACLAVELYLQMETLPDFSMEEAFLSALFHDIGISQVSDTPYSPYIAADIYSRGDLLAHSIIGAEAAERISGISNKVKEGIEQHHERLDGSGSPYALKDAQLSEIGRFIGIIDQFLVYRDNIEGSKIISSISAVEKLSHKSGLFDSKFLNLLQKIYSNHVPDLKNKKSA